MLMHWPTVPRDSAGLWIMKSDGSGSIKELVNERPTVVSQVWAILLLQPIAVTLFKS